MTTNEATGNELERASGLDAEPARRARRRFLIGAATAGLTGFGVRAVPAWAAGASHGSGDVEHGGSDDHDGGGVSHSDGIDAGEVVVWRLAGAETLTCRACAAHSANKVFLERSAALWGRAHVGCRCEPESFTMSAAEATRLGARSRDGGRSVDRRWPT
jgi:hypothetical protein